MVGGSSRLDGIVLLILHCEETGLGMVPALKERKEIKGTLVFKPLAGHVLQSWFHSVQFF